jgi:hypothetical protein
MSEQKVSPIKSDQNKREQKVSPTKSDQDKRDLITLERGWGRRIMAATTPTTSGLAVTVSTLYLF